MQPQIQAWLEYNNTQEDETLTFKIYIVQCKVTRHAKKQENMTCNERNKAKTTDPEITQMTELGGKDIIQTELCSTYSRA